MTVNVFISCGDDRGEFRDAAARVLRRLSQHLVSTGLGPPLLNWDYRIDLPYDAPAGEFERRSLEQVDEAQLFIGILGPTVPPVTRLEILHAFRRQQQGSELRAYVLADPDLITTDHQDLLDEIKRDVDRDVVFGHYETEEDLIHQLYGTLLRYVFRDRRGGGV